MVTGRATCCLWRSKRAIRAETAQIHHQLDSVEEAIDQHLDDYYDDPTPKETKRITDNFIGTNLIPNTDTCFNIIRYEMRLDRQLTRAYKLLVHLQTMRQIETAKEQEIIIPPFVHALTDQQPPSE